MRQIFLRIHGIDEERIPEGSNLKPELAVSRVFPFPDLGHGFSDPDYTAEMVEGFVDDLLERGAITIYEDEDDIDDLLCSIIPRNFPSGKLGKELWRGHVDVD